VLEAFCTTPRLALPCCSAALDKAATSVRFRNVPPPRGKKDNWREKLPRDEFTVRGPRWRQSGERTEYRPITFYRSNACRCGSRSIDCQILCPTRLYGPLGPRTTGDLAHFQTAALQTVNEGTGSRFYRLPFSSVIVLKLQAVIDFGQGMI